MRIKWKYEYGKKMKWGKKGNKLEKIKIKLFSTLPSAKNAPKMPENALKWEFVADSGCAARGNERGNSRGNELMNSRGN